MAFIKGWIWFDTDVEVNINLFNQGLNIPTKKGINLIWLIIQTPWYKRLQVALISCKDWVILETLFQNEMEELIDKDHPFLCS